MGSGVEVRHSLIPFAGKGLFAGKNFKRCDVITEYAGEIVRDEKFVQEYERASLLNADTTPFHYYWNLGRYHGVDAGKVGHRKGFPGGHILNDPRNDQLWNCQLKSVMASEYPDLGKSYNYGKETVNIRLVVVATRDINAGEELFHPYGEDYWNKFLCQKYFDHLNVDTVEKILAAQNKDIE